ncbi:class I SAM-dependent methyltransferase [Brachyspira sp.]|uniref:class I SAM-dependent methyltransferase n=1 Tax=Brachyspira sp. TaxID=1977261 RepID=UPI00261BD1DC|nr:class I SAM-dependent methyltransferase [Brachyspira sp.]
MDKNIKKNVNQFNEDVINKGGYVYNEGFSGYITRKKIVNTWKNLYNFEGKNVLDIGCGDGKYSMELYKIIGDKGSILGLDPSVEAINNANTLYLDTVRGGDI